ncbi:G-type lectin S-receptor-like serine/threonine-protein kinase At2g19130 [Panicum virgatum]|uniref:G-type lectin S-receptor-like serine/threonine-protein kinase At2g19130 n=1 Tax=Panicum virgatum TaxID=38727 RepID=UPI0019D6A27E|nr:G-type lectin S-receptor-like serine/threonine-protein kinase At2g19130 [Panicum virgatum]
MKVPSTSNQPLPLFPKLIPLPEGPGIRTCVSEQPFVTFGRTKAISFVTEGPIPTLLNSWNLVLLDTSNSSAPRTLWQSFDHPTDTLLPGAKLGREATGVTRRLVSRKSAATPSPGPYCFEVDPDAPQLVVKLCGSPVAYWATGAWNGRYFGNIPELAGNVPSFHLAFVDDAREEYLQFNVTAEATVTRNIVDVDGQNKHQVWIDASQAWLTLYAGPKAPCDVYAACGPFAVCSYATGLQPCGCMKGFSVRSPVEWEQGDRTGGCVRDAALDCTSGNSTASSTDGFHSMPGIGLPDRGRGMQNVRSSAECSTACLKNCSCTAYSYGSQGLLEVLDQLAVDQVGVLTDS